MSKISTLPPVDGPLTGAEPVVLVSDGRAKQGPIGGLVEQLAQPYVDQAQGAADELSEILTSIGDELGAVHRYRWGDRLLSYYDPFHVTHRGIFRPVSGILLPFAKTFLDDDQSTPLKDRIPGTLAKETGAVHRFRWGDRLVGYFDPTFAAAPGAFKPVAGALLPAAKTFLDDAPTVPLADRLGGTGGAVDTNLVAFGHSFMTDASGGSTYPARVAATLGVSVENFGLGGQTAERIAARAGVICTQLTVTDSIIPESGVVAVTAITIRLLSTPATTSATRSITGYLGGVHGTLTCVESAGGDDFDTYSFTRTTAGTAVKIAPGTPFVPDIWAKSKRCIIHLNRNSIGNLAENLDLLDLFLASIPHDQYVIVGEWPGGAEPSGSAGYNNIVANNAALAKRYGKHFVEIHRYAIVHGLADLGLSPTAQDTSDIANDVVPTTLRDSQTDLHPSDAGLTIIANRVTERLNALAAGA